MSALCFKSSFFGASASILALIGSAQAAIYETNKVSFRDIVGTVEIKTTNGDEVDVQILQGKKFNTIEVIEKDGVVILSGEPQISTGDADCCDRKISRTVNNRKDRKATTGAPLDEAYFADYPTIVVSMPVKGDVSFEDARIKLDMERLDGKLGLDACYVYGETSDVEQAFVGVVEGSRLVMGNVASGIEIDVSGDADVKIGNASIVDVDIAGPGDVILGEVDGTLDVSIAGSGVVRTTRLEGPMIARIAGSGGVAVKSGIADTLKAIIDGSGGVYFGGQVKRPDLRFYGSGEVRMRSVSGSITQHGDGTVYVGDKVFSDE